jgi:type VI secretion system protein VasD
VHRKLPTDSATWRIFFLNAKRSLHDLESRSLWLCLLALSAILNACASINPNVPRPSTTVPLRIDAAKNMNVGENGQGLSTILRLYKLKDKNAFLIAPYSTYGDSTKEKEAIGTDLVEVRELILSPGQTLSTKEKMPADAAYLGVVALFRSPVAQRWRYVFSTADAAKSGVIIGVHTCAMSATNVAPVGMTLDDAGLLSPVKCK